ncbi:MAG: ABC transporter substrate-binding protein [Patescibacteria group bacterium]|jgi:branched-chain amino acid transport system substrate-binding protein
MNTNKISSKFVWSVIGIMVVLIVGYFVFKGPANLATVEQVKVGAILPLSGPAAVFGEPMKNGLDMAIKDNKNIQIIYEDSKAVPADGVTAYQKLIAQGVNVVVSAYSGVSIPLAKLALENKTPLIMSIVAASNVTNTYAYRYYAKPSSYVIPAFTDPSSPLNKLTDIAVLHQDSEYGKSISDIIVDVAKEKDKKIVINESFKVNETDFSTVMLKIKNAKPQAVLFVPSMPAEAIAIMKKADELKVNAIFIETGAAFSDPAVQKQAPAMTFYTTGFKFSLPDDNSVFKDLYKSAYGANANFAAAFGYDMGKLIVACAKKSSNIQACLSQTTSVDGITGKITGITGEEINPPMILMKVN